MFWRCFVVRCKAQSTKELDIAFPLCRGTCANCSSCSSSVLSDTWCRFVTASSHGGIRINSPMMLAKDSFLLSRSWPLRLTSAAQYTPVKLSVDALWRRSLTRVVPYQQSGRQRLLLDLACLGTDNVGQAADDLEPESAAEGPLNVATILQPSAKYAFSPTLASGMAHCNESCAPPVTQSPLSHWHHW